MKNVLSIALGGSIGALLRYGVSFLSTKVFSSTYPMGTFLVNLIGAFLIGFFWGMFEKNTVSEQLKSFVLIGLIGSFTTFSTLSFETVKLFQAGDTKLAMIHLFFTNLLGLIMVIAGYLVSVKINFVFIKK